jgi:aspartate aminotransferase
VFGDLPEDKAKAIVSVQTLSGTGSLRCGAEFVGLFHMAPVYFSDPTWGNHLKVFEKSRFTDIRKYKYWNAETRGVAFEELKECMNTAPEGSVFVLHACAHNPTGVDLTQEQWMELATIMQARNLFPFFDTAYQGFATGNLDNDAFAIRHFHSQGFAMIVCQSMAKNFGLYGERIGCLHIVTPSEAVATNVMSQIKLIIRPMYSNPPIHGAAIVA